MYVTSGFIPTQATSQCPATHILLRSGGVKPGNILNSCLYKQEIVKCIENKHLNSLQYWKYVKFNILNAKLLMPFKYYKNLMLVNAMKMKGFVNPNECNIHIWLFCNWNSTGISWDGLSSMIQSNTVYRDVSHQGVGARQAKLRSLSQELVSFQEAMHMYQFEKAFLKCSNPLSSNSKHNCLTITLNMH